MELIEIEIKNYSEETSELKAEFKRLGLQSFDSLHFQYRKIPEGTYRVEPEILFSNQYNTKEGLRIFEKCSRLQDLTMKPLDGYYIAEGIEKIRKLQKDRYVCGYCGRQYIKPKDEFCLACIDSEYLEVKSLPLLRLKPVYPEKFPERGELTEDEKSWLLPMYKDAQLHGKTERGKKRIKAQREKIEKNYRKAATNAKNEHDGLLWLMDHGINTDNVIYYDHTSMFSFGWRKPIEDELKSELLDLLCEFPFDYEFHKDS